MDFAQKENEEELTGEENDVEEAMLDELVDDADVETDDDVLTNDASHILPTLREDDDNTEEEDDDLDTLVEEDAEDVDFDSFDDEDHL